MSGIPAALLLALAIDGEAALGHASRLAALGPHPLGSPRSEVAAEYVAAQLREAGLSEVSRQSFRHGSEPGTNVVGVLRGASAGVILIGAHHDTAPGSPGAWRGAGVALVIELAREAAAAGARPRTLAFVSWDGGLAGGAGQRAFLETLRREPEPVVGALVIDGAGWSGGAPAVHVTGVADVLRPGPRFPPGWLVAAALRNSGLALGQPYLGWAHQPAVRMARARTPSGAAPLLQAGIPAVAFWDASPWRPYVHSGTSSDAADRLDAASLGRFGAALAAATESVALARGSGADEQWLALGGRVAGVGVLLAAGAASVVPGLLVAATWGVALFLLRVVQAALFGVLLWRHAALAMALLLLPNLLPVLPRSRVSLALAAAPAGATLLLVGTAALWGRAGQEPYFAGFWLHPWELAILGVAFMAALVRPPRGRKKRRRR
jgi:hypothetical protein